MSNLHISIHRGKVVHFSFLSSSPLFDWLVVIIKLVVRHATKLWTGSIGPVFRGAGEAWQWTGPKHRGWVRSTEAGGK